MKKWIVYTKRADFNELARRYNISPMLARIIRNRDVISDDDINMFLNGTKADLYNPSLMKDIDKAVKLLDEAIDAGEKIYIIGDYDIDGVCSSAILKKGLERCGATVGVRIPDRIIDGYGMNMSMIDEAVNGGYGYIITCDNGIAASREVQYAKENGLKVIITDHHEVPYETLEDGSKRYIIPCADAVVDPKQEDCEYPFKGLCGGGVAYKLMKCMTDKHQELKELDDELLMLAAFATIGDIMELRSENRIIVKYGLEIMKKTDNKGMKALIDATGVDRSKISPYHIGFILGPCINATGRLASANNALNLFMAESDREAALIANELKSLNDSRKDLTERFIEEAIATIEESDELKEAKVLVVFIPDCHESLAGIIAGRIRERYYKPVFVLTRAEDGVKGSGRSIEDYNMFEEMNRCKELFTKFGGHKLAAGLSMEEEKVHELLVRLNDITTLTDDDLTEKIRIDIPMPISHATMSFAEELDKLAPYGNGNPGPLFAQKGVMIVKKNVIGKNQNVVKLVLRCMDDAGNKYDKDAIIFGNGPEIMEELEGREKIDIVYSIKINAFRGERTVQLEIKDYQ